MRSLVFHLVDESGNQLVDESGNELIASVAITDYRLSARNSKLILHGYAPVGQYNTSTLMFYLVDESGNQLVDESGNELTARINVNSRLLHAQETRQILHGG